MNSPPRLASAAFNSACAGPARTTHAAAAAAAAAKPVAVTSSVVRRACTRARRRWTRETGARETGAIARIVCGRRARRRARAVLWRTSRRARRGKDEDGTRREAWRRVDARRRAAGEVGSFAHRLVYRIHIKSLFSSLNSLVGALAGAARFSRRSRLRRLKTAGIRSACVCLHPWLSTCTLVIVALCFSRPLARVRTRAVSRSLAPLGLPRYKPESASALQSGVLPSPFLREIVVSVTIRLIDVRDLRHQGIIRVGVRQ